MMSRVFLSCFITVMSVAPAFAEPTNGYYRFPSIHGDTIVFAADGFTNQWLLPLSHPALSLRLFDPLAVDIAVAP